MLAASTTAAVVINHRFRNDTNVWGISILNIFRPFSESLANIPQAAPKDKPIPLTQILA